MGCSSVVWERAGFMMAMRGWVLRVEESGNTGPCESGSDPGWAEYGSELHSSFRCLALAVLSPCHDFKPRRNYRGSSSIYPEY